MSRGNDNASMGNEDNWNDAVEWLREQPEYSEGLPPSTVPQDEERWCDAVEWLQEQPEYSEGLPPCTAPQNSMGKLLLKTK